MDDFVKKAFADANGAVMRDEFQAWNRTMIDPDIPHLAAADAVGLAKINDLCGAVIKAGQADTLAQYAHFLMLTGFHLGYHARMEDER
jgi:hypothetical protein